MAEWHVEVRWPLLQSNWIRLDVLREGTALMNGKYSKRSKVCSAALLSPDNVIVVTDGTLGSPCRLTHMYLNMWVCTSHCGPRRSFCGRLDPTWLGQPRRRGGRDSVRSSFMFLPFFHQGICSTIQWPQDISSTATVMSDEKSVQAN